MIARQMLFPLFCIMLYMVNAQSPPAAASSASFSSITSYNCEGVRKIISCPSTPVQQKMTVLKARYGRYSQDICNSGSNNNQQNTNCDKNVTDVMSNLCNGQPSCSFKVDQKGPLLGPDPCVGTSKYLELEYYCSIYTTSCEGSTVAITCPSKRQKITVFGARYGRYNQNECPTGQNQQQNTNNCDSNVIDVVMKLCDGKSSCSFKVGNEVLGEPCGGTSKYLNVQYICE